MGDQHTHTHDNPHDHDHDHPHAHERYSDRPHPEFVVLEIGGDLGALIVHADDDMHGVEIEISRTGDDASRTHKDVLERPLGARRSFSAVFDQVPEGSYTLWVEDRARARDIAVAGGRVVELDWRGAA